MTLKPTMPIQGVHIPKTQLGLTKMKLILEAAETLFANKGFYEVSVSDICKEAHTAVGTFYIYFDSKTDLYRYLVDRYKHNIKACLADAIAGCSTRLEMEREGIKAFIRYAVANPNVYDIIWGSLSVEKQMFKDYYESFAESYARALNHSRDSLSVDDVNVLSYTLMGIANFLGLKAMFETMDGPAIDAMIDNTILPILEKGMFRQTD